jgi:putative endonuclease
MDSTHKLTKKQLGALGEQFAIRFLLSQDYEVIATNWRCRIGEIDIIAIDHETLVFAEVRSRQRYHHFGTAKESMNWRKQKKIRDVANYYLAVHDQHDQKVRFDFVSVEWEQISQQPLIQLIKSAF